MSIILLKNVKMSQQSGSVQFEAGNLTLVLVALVVIGLAIYVYFEFNKIKGRLLELENKLLSGQGAGPRAEYAAVEETTPSPNIAEHFDFIESPQQSSEDPSKEIDLKKINILTEEETTIQDPNELSEAEIRELMNDDTQSNATNKHSETSDIFDALRSRTGTEDLDNKQEKEEVPIDEDSIPEAIFENITSAIENIQKAEAIQKNEELDYTKMTVSQLKSILTDLELPTSGNKTKLVERIQQNKSLKI